MAQHNTPDDSSLLGIIQELRDRIESLERAYGNSSKKALPKGGTTGQVLKKTSNADYAVSWQNDNT